MTAAGWTSLEERARSVADHRRAWFLSLIRQGREADAAGRLALAAHCRARVEEELEALRDAAPSGARPDPGASAPSPLAALAARRGNAARARLAELLARHGGRLSQAERASFQAALEALPAGAAEAEGRVSELRRRLLDRLLRASRYRRQGAILAKWAARPAVTPEAVPTGPYNDYVAVEDMLRRVAGAGSEGAEWAAEFLDLYGNMRAVRMAYGEMLAGR